MKFLSTIVIFISAYPLINGKSTGLDYIDTINEILLMGNKVENRQIRPDLTPIKKDTEDCTCLPAYLCNNNLQIRGKPCTDNTCTTSVRMGTNYKSCSSGTVLCCRDGIYSSAMTPPVATPRTPNQGRPDLTPINQLTISCPCVSPHQCEYGIPCTDGCDAIDPKINDGTCSDPTLVRCCSGVNNGTMETTTKLNLTPVNTTTLSCPCVPSYQCEDGTPCTDGCDVINVKINDGTCWDPTHVRCCNEVNNGTTVETTTKLNLNPVNTPTLSCPCVPYYQCDNGTPCTDGCDGIDVKISDGACSDPTHVPCCNGVNNGTGTVVNATRPNLTPVNTPTLSCPCLPYYQCENGIPCTDGCDAINVKINDGTCLDPTQVRCCNVVIPTPIKANITSCSCIPQCYNGIPCTHGCDVTDMRIIDDSCKLPNVLCCKENNTSVSPSRNNVETTSSTAAKRRSCGVRNPNGVGFRIVDTNTNLANFGEFPWMVAILFEDKDPTDTQEYYPEQTLLKYQCGGSLIHPQVVLTATHCVVSKEKIFHVRAGEWDIKSTEETFPHQDRVVEKVVTHSEFHSGGLYNDIALLILKTPVNITKNVDTVCLPAQDEILEDIRCYTSGWGKNVFQMSETTLKKVQLPIIQKDLCQNQMRTARSQDDFTLHESFVCAGGEKGKDACEGDGGSPLACPFSNNPKRYFQAGIVSWGIGCGLENVPGLYANVARFRNWVDEHMIKLGYDTSYYIY